jgi:ABC-type phosphate/phosphonate transport system substrate-binding protein
MLFVPSVEQGTLVQRGGELARFLHEDSGLFLHCDVPTSYAAVIQALGSGQADVAWIPAFAYVLARERYGVEAKLQVVREVDRHGIVVTRSGAEEPARVAELAARPIAFPRQIGGELRERLREVLDREAPGWVEVQVESDKDAVGELLEGSRRVDGAVSSHVFSGPHDFIGDGRKELAYERPGTMEETRIIFTTGTAVGERTTVYHGGVYCRTDSVVRRLEDLNGLRFAFADQTSTSGHIFPKMALDRLGVTPGRVYHAGGHPNVIQAVRDGKVDGGAAFYSPPGKKEAAAELLVGDARALILKRMPERERRTAFLEEVRVLALTDPIPNDVCVVRRGFSGVLWERFEASFERFLQTDRGQAAYFDLVAGVAVAHTADPAFDGFRRALEAAGLSPETLLEAQEAKLERGR